MGVKAGLCVLIVLVGLHAALHFAKPASSAVPPACAAAGYTVETLHSDFSKDGKTFDQGTTFEPGYDWYRWNFFNVKPNLSLVRKEPDGSISARGDLNGHITSAALIPDRPGFVGTAFGGGACVEVVLRFDPVRADDGRGHPSFWGMSYEHLNGRGDDQQPDARRGFTDFFEWDIFEYYKVPSPGFLSSWIEWYGLYIPDRNAKRPDGCRRPYCKRAGSFDADTGAVPASTDWNRWQRVTGVWIPAKDGRDGSIQTFFNDVPLDRPRRWSGYSLLRALDRLDFSVLDRQHMVFVISSGTKPIFVRSVRVFQRDGKSNLVN